MNEQSRDSPGIQDERSDEKATADSSERDKLQVVQAKEHRLVDNDDPPLHEVPLDSRSFPDQPRPGSTLLPQTIPNLNRLLDGYRIHVGYDVIKKKLVVTIPGHRGTPDNRDNAAISRVISLAALNGLQTTQVPSFLEVIGDEHPINQVVTWITSRPWDGVDRLQALYDTLVERKDYPKPLKEELLYRWLLSAVAAAFKPSGFRSRGVLTFQGPQSIGKTAWINSLISNPLLRDQLVRLDHHLDAHNKDSILTAISHWIVEIGELDSSFRKDLAKLKGLLTSDRDKVRRPYARVDSDYPRRTVFCATVNDAHFLIDTTGNSRFWTIPLQSVNFDHGIDMQQVFAQLLLDYQAGEHWWLDRPIERCLEELNADHRSISAIRERLLDEIDMSRVKQDGLSAYTATEALRHVGVEQPTNGQCKDAAATLREVLGEPKRIQGRDRWRVPFRTSPLVGGPVDDDVY